MNGAALAYERCSGSGEWLMRIGVATASPILFVPPLFEEMNRTRALLAATMRNLAARSHCCWLLDLPGTGESERPLEQVRWDEWREAVRAAAAHAREKSGQRAHCASIRGGALLDEAAEARSYWRFAPVAGASLARDLARAGLAGGAALAGYTPSSELMAHVEAASPAAVAPLRVAKLASDRTEADARLEGPALWRRSEPGTSSSLADAIAENIDGWVRQCGGC